MGGASGRACDGWALGRGQSAVAPQPGPVRRCCPAGVTLNDMGKTAVEAENGVIEGRAS